MITGSRCPCFCRWVSLRLVSNFNRMQMLCKDHAFILECAMESDKVEVSACGQYVRSTH